MKRNYIVTLFVAILCTLSSFAQNIREVTLSEAYELASEIMNHKDVDYYYRETKTIFWYIFVDAEPMKGWEHEAYIITIPKIVSTNASHNDIIESIKVKEVSYPQYSDLIELNVKKRYQSIANIKPFVKKSNDTNSDNVAVANRTYALIISGGITKTSNHERYWNDCSFIYQTLVNKYIIPKENIFPIMSDGDNPEDDQHLVKGGYASQNLDLDKDGIKDIYLSATKANIVNTLSYLENLLQKNDHLFIYVIDHGGRDSNGSYICLWNHEKLYDHELATLLESFSNKSVNINLVLGQCYSGGFVEKIDLPGCVVASACKKDQSSYACSTIPYDEFVYHWTCAINEANHVGNKIYSDTDANDRVTMKEAFEYADYHDRLKDSETPQYKSTPISIGEDLAFNNLVPEYDLYIKDNEEDTGKEPNTSTYIFWKSPSVWVRNYPDSIEQHENPYYSLNHTSACVYVRVHNRGKADYKGGKWLHAYWAKAATDFSKSEWKGDELYEDTIVSGGHIRAKHLGAIKAGEYEDFYLDWTLPSDILNESQNGTEKHHFCILARIMDTAFDDEKAVDVNSKFEIKQSNKIAQKNVSVIYKEDLQKDINVYIKNISSTKQYCSLEFIPKASFDEALYEKANIELRMSPDLYKGWTNGGSQSNNVARPIGRPTSVRFISKDSRLYNIDLEPRQVGKVAMNIKFNTVPTNTETYTFDLIQRDENDSIIGGETFVIHSPNPSQNPANIICHSSDNGTNILSVENNNDHFSSFSWIDSKGNIISQNDYLETTPSMQDEEYSVIAYTHEGEASVGSIMLGNIFGIEYLSLDSDILSMRFSHAAPNNAFISIRDILNGSIINTELVETGTLSKNISIASLPKGSYIVTYSINDEIIDTKKVTKQ